MSKVTITIDDTNPALVAAFGENSLETIADEFGYMTMVEKTAEELPEKVLDEETQTEIYPEGTELYKPNPQSKAAFVAEKILTENIVPRLLVGFKNRKQVEANQSVDIAVKQAEALVASVAVIEVL